MKPTVQGILAKVKHIQPLSQTLVRLLQLAGKEDHSMQEMTRIIACDNALTANVLKVVKSAAFAPREPITSLPMAVTRLGERLVVGIAVGSGASLHFSSALDGYDSRRGELWEHSLRTAIAAREFGRLAVSPMEVDQAYTGGLLHDLGKIILSDFLRQELAGQTDNLAEELRQHERHPDFLAVERRLLNTDHCEIGMALGREWRLPESLCAAMAWHHAPSKAPEEHRALVYCVHGGDFVAMLCGAGTGMDSLQYSMDKGFYAHFRLGPGAVERIMLTVQDEYKQTAGPMLGTAK